MLARTYHHLNVSENHQLRRVILNKYNNNSNSFHRNIAYNRNPEGTAKIIQRIKRRNSSSNNCDCFGLLHCKERNILICESNRCSIPDNSWVWLIWFSSQADPNLLEIISMASFPLISFCIIIGRTYWILSSS